MGDIIDCLKHKDRSVMISWEDCHEEGYVVDYKSVETAMYVRINAENADELKASISEMFGKLTYIERKNRPENELAFITPTMVESDSDANLAILSHSAEIKSKISLL